MFVIGVAVVGLLVVVVVVGDGLFRGMACPTVVEVARYLGPEQEPHSEPEPESDRTSVDRTLVRRLGVSALTMVRTCPQRYSLAV